MKERLLVFSCLYLVLSSCKNNQAPIELQGVWISSYVIGHVNNDLNAEIFTGNSSWEIYTIDSSHLTIHQFKNRMNYLENFEISYNYEYQPGLLILETADIYDSIIVESVSTDSMVILVDPSGLRKRVFRRLKPQPSIFPPISKQGYELVGTNFRDTILIIDDGKLVRIQEGLRHDGQQYSWYTEHVHFFWFFNIEDQHGEPLFVQSISEDTLHFKSYGYKHQKAYMVPVLKSSLITNLAGDWQQTSPAESIAFLPFLNLNGEFNSADSTAFLRIHADSLILNYVGKTGSWFVKDRFINNAILFDSPELDYQFNIWRIKFINQDKIEISIYAQQFGTFINYEPISFKRVQK